jgi:acyl CoA:acetate/3-ketoacid CoA transferase
MLPKLADISLLNQIKDNDTIAISGFNMATTPEYLIYELYKKYEEQGHPKNIFIVSDTLPAVPGRMLWMAHRSYCLLVQRNWIW